MTEDLLDSFHIDHLLKLVLVPERGHWSVSRRCMVHGAWCMVSGAWKLSLKVNDIHTNERLPPPLPFMPLLHTQLHLPSTSNHTSPPHPSQTLCPLLESQFDHVGGEWLVEDEGLGEEEEVLVGGDEVPTDGDGHATSEKAFVARLLARQVVEDDDAVVWHGVLLLIIIILLLLLFSLLLFSLLLFLLLFQKATLQPTHPPREKPTVMRGAWG